MKRLLLTLVVLATWAGPVLAQDTPSLSNLEVALWPEFDRPEVLVIYRGLFAPETPLPLLVEIRIPARAGEPTAMAYVGEGDSGSTRSIRRGSTVTGWWCRSSWRRLASSLNTMMPCQRTLKAAGRIPIAMRLTMPLQY